MIHSANGLRWWIQTNFTKHLNKDSLTKSVLFWKYCAAAAAVLEPVYTYQQQSCVYRHINGFKPFCQLTDGWDNVHRLQVGSGLENVFWKLFTSETTTITESVRSKWKHKLKKKRFRDLVDDTHTSTISTECPQCLCLIRSMRNWESGVGMCRESTMWRYSWEKNREKLFKYRFILVKKYAISFGRVLSITSLTHILQDKHRTAIFCFEQAQETH